MENSLPNCKLTGKNSATTFSNFRPISSTSNHNFKMPNTNIGRLF